MSEVFIAGFARTPFGGFLGSLSSFSAPQLGAIAIKEALARAKVAPGEVQEVFMGNVLSAGVGQAPARQASILAGIPQSVPCTTINKVCGSGMKAVMLGAQSIRLGDQDTVVAGGMESMSQAPYLLPKARTGYRLGHQTTLDAMIHDGLWDPYHDQHMGNCAELCAKEKNYSREAQDAYAIESFRRAQAADFGEEIVAVKVPNRKGPPTLVGKDEGPAKVDFAKIPTLRPAFEKDGTVTAANASTINDGAGALVLLSEKAATGHTPIARIVASAQHAQDPQWFTTAPIPAMEKAMQRSGWSVDTVDLFEVNEAFAVVALAARDGLKIPEEKFNVLGGAIAVGHPIGASGARIIMTLITALRQRGLKRGLAGICIGGGEATALALELC